MKKADFNYDIEKYTLLFANNLSEKDRRLFFSLEAMRIGYYGISETSQKYNINKHTLRKGQKELLTENLVPAGKIRRKGGGRKKKVRPL